MCYKKMIDYPLFHNPVEITNALVTVASQENCDGPEYDLMMNAAEHTALHKTWQTFRDRVVECRYRWSDGMTIEKINQASALLFGE